MIAIVKNPPEIKIPPRRPRRWRRIGPTLMLVTLGFGIGYIFRPRVPDWSDAMILAFLWGLFIGVEELGWRIHLKTFYGKWRV